MASVFSRVIGCRERLDLNDRRQTGRLSAHYQGIEKRHGRRQDKAKVG